MTKGEKIRAARKAKSLTAKQVGVALGYKVQHGEAYVIAWELGIRPVPRNKIVPLARMLDLELEGLI